jgi:hypothetical protein
MAIRLPKRWFRKVSADMGLLPDALAYYLAELDDGHKELEIKGNLMRQNMDQAGLVAYYDGMHSDLDGMLWVVERNLKRVRGEVLRDYVENSPTHQKLNVTELKVIMEADTRVMEANELVDEVKYVYKQYGSLMKAFEQRGFDLSNVVKLRLAGMEEVDV